MSSCRYAPTTRRSPVYRCIMSETAQGPDWWRASDGKWYPPQSRAPTPPPPPPSSDMQIAPDWWLASNGRWYPPRTSDVPAFSTNYRGAAQSPSVPPVSRGLSGTLQGFFWAVAGLSAIIAISSLVGLVAFNTFWDARPGSLAEADAADNLNSADSAINSLGGVATIVAIAIFVLIIIWTYQAHKATQVLCRGTRTWSSGWSVGSWFIPLANAVIPKLVLTEIEKIALAHRTHGLVGEDWRKHPTAATGWLWWIFFVVGTAVFLYGFGSFDETGGTPSSWRVGYWMTAAGSTALAVSGCCGALYVRRIGRALSPATT